MIGKRRKKRTPRLKSRHIILFFLGLVLILAVTSRVFVVKSIGVKLNDVNCVTEEQVKDKLSLQGKNLLALNTNSLENQVKSQFICVKGISLTKELPNKILVDISGRKGLAVIRSFEIIASDSASLSATTSAQIQVPTGGKGTPYLVDEEGVVFAQTDEGVNLPTVLMTDMDLNLGKGFKNDLVKKTVLVLQKVKQFNLQTIQAIIYPNGIMLIDGKTKLQFNLKKDIDIQLASLQLILDKAKIDNESMEFIDLGFDKPVVRFSPKEKK